MTPLRWLSCLALIAAVGCGDDDDGGDVDAGDDSATDAASDAGDDDEDAGRDASRDAAGDTLDAADEDAAEDASDDAAQDAADDGASDAAEDAQADAADASEPECEDSEECAPTGFCRGPSLGSSGTCHPYAEEGERCGGFVAPGNEERCAPDRVCLETSPLLPDAPGICGLEATIEELRTSPATYDGHVVGVTGYVVAEDPSCTEIACSDAMPCCQTCSGRQGLNATIGEDSPIWLNDEELVGYECSGTNCNPMETCTQPTGAHVRVVGRFRMWDGLEVQSIQSVEF